MKKEKTAIAMSEKSRREYGNCFLTRNSCSSGKTGKIIRPMFAYFAKTTETDPRACRCF